MQTIIDEVVGAVDNEIPDVASGLPAEFPPEIADPIFDGIETAARKFS